MRWIRGGLIACAALASVGSAQAEAQSVESIMQARERLELTDDQLESLEVIRRETVEQRTAEMAEMTELRSQLRAGQIQRSDLLAAVEDRRAGAQALAEQRREQIDAVLTEAQLESVEQMRQRAGRMPVGLRRGNRPGMRGGRLGPGRPLVFRGGPGFRRGPPRAGRFRLRGFGLR